MSFHFTHIAENDTSTFCSADPGKTRGGSTTFVKFFNVKKARHVRDFKFVILKF